MTSTWLPLALGATLAWGLGQVVAKRGATALGPRRMVATVALGEALLFGVLGLLTAGPLPGPPQAALLGLAAGFAGMLGYVAYYEAIARGTISRVGTITAAYPAGTVVLALLLLQEVLTGLQALGVVLLLASAMLLARAEGRQAGEGAGSITALVLLSFLLWAAWGVLVKLAVEGLGEGATLVYFGVANATVASALLALPRSSSPPLREARRSWRWPLAAVGLGGGGVLLMTYAFAQGPAALVAPVTGAYPVITVLAAGVLLRERVQRHELLAFLAFAAGLFAVAWA